MARVDLRCGCGYMFFVSDVQLKGGVKCPSCLRPVNASGPPEAPPPPAPLDHVISTKPAKSSGPVVKLIAWGAAAVLIIGGIIATIKVVGSGRENPYEKEVADARAKRRAEPKPIASPSASPSTPVAAPEPPKPSAPAPARVPAPADPAPTVVRPNPLAPPPSQAAAPADLPADLVQKLRAEVLPLHAFYLSLIANGAEKSRLQSLASSGKGLPEDSRFLSTFLLSAKLKAVLDEKASIAENYARLEKDALEGLPLDRVKMADGRLLQCRVIEELPDTVRIERKLSTGVNGQMNLRREQVSEVQKGKGVGGEFNARWATARKAPVLDQMALLLWCKENTLLGQAKLTAYLVLRADPSHPQARAEAELPLNPVKAAEELLKDGSVTYQGKTWPARQLREKLIKDGYVLFNGEFHSRKEKIISVPGLFRYDRQDEKPVILGNSGAMVCHEEEITYKLAQDVASGSFIEQPEVKYLRRFYSMSLSVKQATVIAPGLQIPQSTSEVEVRAHVDEPIPASGTNLRGEVTMTVPLNEPVIEASVMTLAEVKPGSSITIFLLEDGKRTHLYTCAGKESDSHKLPDIIRGKKQIDFVAEIKTQASFTPKVERRRLRGLKKGNNGQILQRALDVYHHRQIPDYKAMLFPSNSNTLEVFRLRVTLADPAPAITKLFAECPEALR